MQNIYRLALQVQDASNPNGVANSLVNEVLPAIRAEAGYREQGTRYILTNPAYILFIDKLVSMIPGVWTNDDSGRVSWAYSECHVLAEGLEAVEAAKLTDGPLAVRPGGPTLSDMIGSQG
jgi:hypothetical protein